MSVSIPALHSCALSLMTFILGAFIFFLSFFFFCKFREKQVCLVFTCCVCLFHSERWATYWPSDWCQGFICSSQQSPSSSATSKITFTDSVSSCNVQCRHRHRLLWMNEWINIQKRQWARSWSLTIRTNEQTESWSNDLVFAGENDSVLSGTSSLLAPQKPSILLACQVSRESACPFPNSL